MRKDEIKPNIRPEISQDVGLWRKSEYQTLFKALDISSVTAWVASDLLKTQAILSDTALRRSAVIEKTCHHTGNQKKGHISQGDEQAYYLQVFQRLH